MLKVKFWRVENVVLMKVLEQGAEINKGIGCFYQDKLTKMNIYSREMPALNPTAIYVKGTNNDYNNLLASINLNSVSDAEKFYNQAIQTIKNYNKSLKKSREMPIMEDIEIYEIED